MENPRYGVPRVNRGRILMLEWHPEWHAEHRRQSAPVRTGTARRGLVGLVDIGVSASSYLFRVSLPGVPKSSIRCQIDRTGKVVIRGVTWTGITGGRLTQAFILSNVNLPTMGNFSVSFYLPGPVDTRTFAGTHRLGIFEGIVRKAP